MISHPAWFVDGADFASDKAAHELVCAGASDANTVHRAARHHNWRQSAVEVQAWTQQIHQAARSACWSGSWQGVCRVNRQPTLELVTHRLVTQLSDPQLKARILASTSDPEALKRAAMDWHRELVQSSPSRSLWLGERSDVDAGRSFSPADLHHVVASLGLWHFGEMPADSRGAVLRIVYRVDKDVALYKPDWRHGYPNFYFAPALGEPQRGLTRDLETGKLACTEWVAAVAEFDPGRHIVEAHCAVPARSRCHYDLPAPYWGTLVNEIHAQVKAVT